MSRSSLPPVREARLSSRTSHSSGSTSSSFHADASLAALTSSPDSGYYGSPRASTTITSVSLQDAYQQWKAADDASRTLGELERSVEERRDQLKTTTARLTELEENCKPLKRKKSIMSGILGKPKPNLSVVVDPTSEVFGAGLTGARNAVAELQRRLQGLGEQLEATTDLAKHLDDYFDILKHSLEEGPLPSWRFIEGNEAAISRAEKSVAKIEATYVDSQKMTDAMLRAQLAIQSAHHHYDQAMFFLGGVCGSQRSKIAAIMADEQSKEMTYKEAAEWAQKAQICFNECMRALEPHRDLLGDEAQDCEELQQTGLLQAVQVYNLNYGGKALQFGISSMSQMQIMLQKQEAVFQRLTSFAVWVQNFTKHSESIHRGVRDRRDTARRKLVALWMNDTAGGEWPSSPISPVSPY